MPEHGVAGGMAVRVVDLFEAVEVDQEHRNLGGPGGPDAIGELAPVGEPGQRVVAGLEAQSFAQFPLLGHVPGVDHHAADATLLDEVDRDHGEPAPALVVVLRAQLERGLRARLGEHGVHLGGDPLDVARVDQVEHVPVQVLAELAADDPLHGRVHVPDDAVGADDRGDVGGVPQQRLLPALPAADLGEAIVDLVQQRVVLGEREHLPRDHQRHVEQQTEQRAPGGHAETLQGQHDDQGGRADHRAQVGQQAVPAARAHGPAGRGAPGPDGHRLQPRREEREQARDQDQQRRDGHAVQARAGQQRVADRLHDAADHQGYGGLPGDRAGTAQPELDREEPADQQDPAAEDRGRVTARAGVRHARPGQHAPDRRAGRAQDDGGVQRDPDPGVARPPAARVQQADAADQHHPEDAEQALHPGQHEAAATRVA